MPSMHAILKRRQAGFTECSTCGVEQTDGGHGCHVKYNRCGTFVLYIMVVTKCIALGVLGEWKLPKNYPRSRTAHVRLLGCL